MLIWLLAVILLASLAALGYRQGAIRVAMSFLGICLGVLLALPLAKPMTIPLKALGVTQPLVLWLLPPVLAFCLVSALFKGGAFFLHQKIEMYFKYKAGDLRLSLFERLNARLGLCLGLLNGTAYFCLISLVIYLLGYWTVQMDTGAGNPWTLRLLNRAAVDLNQTGFSVTARALERMPASYFEAADVAGVLYRNTLLEARLARYPAFLLLGERPEFRALANDATFTDLRVRQASLAELLRCGPVQTIVQSPDMLRHIWGLVQPNLKDLRAFLETGVSEKYADQPILGRWTFSPRGTLAAIRRNQPNISSTQMARLRQIAVAPYTRAHLVIGLEGQDGRLVVKDIPRPSTTPGAPLEFQTTQGTWEGIGERYTLKFALGESEITALGVIEGERLTLTLAGQPIVFEREH